MMTATGSSNDTTFSSSPFNRHDRVFSDETVEVTPKGSRTPLSSSPGFPWERRKQIQDGEIFAPASSSARCTKNVFSILGKRKALDQVNPNIRQKKAKTARQSGKPLAQMQMSLGQEIQKRCKQCGMEFVAPNAEDRKLHDRFHKQNTEGYDVGRDFVAKTPKSHLFRGSKDGDVIAEVSAHDHHHRRKRGQAVLEVVQIELGAISIPEDDIWKLKKKAMSSTANATDEPSFRAYLYIRGTKCIGFLLVQRICEAFKVVPPKQILPSRPNRSKTEVVDNKTAVEALKARRQRAEQAQQAIKVEIEAAVGEPIHLSKAAHPAYLGISRIWTSATHRGQGIASRLLNTAISQHNKRASQNESSHENMSSERNPHLVDDYQTVSAGQGNLPKIDHKDQIAFSQPTNAGACLARNWYGKAYGWGVYMD